MAHALLSPSSAVRWMSCPGSVALTKDMPDPSSKYADEGTLAHAVAEAMLTGKPVDGEIERDMRLYVEDYVGYVQNLADGGVLMVERKLDISGITGEAGAHGTSDAVVIQGDEMCIVDLKYGMGEPVQADNNPQLMIYALAALREFELSYDIAEVRLVIHQPRLNSVSEWTLAVEELEAFGLKVAEAAAATALPDAPLVPTTKGCRWCRAKATCPVLAAEVYDLFDTVPETATPDALAIAMSKVDLVETWTKAVRAETERRLLAGEPVDGFKLVQGRRGARAWGDKEAAEAMLKKLRLKVEQMYDLSLITPATAEKLHKAGEIGPRQWPKVVELISQSEGKPSVAPESDKRPALTVSATADDFETLS